VCNELMEDHRKETGQTIRLNHATIINHAEGKLTQAQANSHKSWLTPEEMEAVIQFLIEVSHQGFPLSYRYLKKHVDEILHAHLGNEFRAESIGKCWINQ
ncbi:hypothetical protein ARMSODRAFT_884381, partial [Armillaria solidipes]